MKIKPKVIKVYLNSNKYQGPIIINQYNRNVPFVFEVFNADGTPASIGNTDVVKMEIAIGRTAIIKSTGFTIDGNKVSWSLDREISLNSGHGTFNFIIEDTNNTRISSNKIDIIIESNSIDENTQSSTFLVTVLEKLQGLITNASKIYTDINLASYIKKEVNKGLSSNDYTNADKLEVNKVKNKANKSNDDIDANTLKVKGNNVYHEGNKPTPSDIGAVATEEFSNKKSLNGYTKLPNGMILQWGQVDVSFSSTDRKTTTVTYPIPFTTQVFITIGSERNNSITPFGRYQCACETKTLTTFDLHMVETAFDSGRTGTARFQWFAVGY